MSLMGMRQATNKYWPVVAVVFALLMAVTAFAGLGANLFNRGPAAPTQNASAEKPVATVGDLPVTKPMLDETVQQMLQQQAMFGQAVKPQPEQMDVYRIHALDQFKQDEALIAAAKKAGVEITAADIAEQRETIWQLQRPSALQTLGLPATATDQQIDAELAKQGSAATVASVKASFPEYRMRVAVAQEGLQKALRSQVQVTADQVRKSYDDIQVRHILVNFGEGHLPEEQAKAKAQKLLDAIKADPSKMPQLAKENSDDPGSAKNGGFYDWAPASQYVPAFTQAALTAGVGKVYPELVRVVQSNYSGFHIVKLEGERPGKDLPKDFAKNTQTYIDKYRDQQVNQKLQEAVQAAEPSIAVTVTDPELHGIQLAMDAAKVSDEKARSVKLAQALTELAKVSKADDPMGVVPLQRAQILQMMKRDKDAVAALNDALTYRNSPETRLQLAALYLKQKDNKNAKLQLAEAQKLAIPDPQLQMYISQMLGQAGDKAGAKKAMDKAMELMKRQSEMQKQEAEAAAAAAPPAAASPSASPAAPAKPKSGG